MLARLYHQYSFIPSSTQNSASTAVNGNDRNDNCVHSSNQDDDLEAAFEQDHGVHHRIPIDSVNIDSDHYPSALHPVPSPFPSTSISDPPLATNPTSSNPPLATNFLSSSSASQLSTNAQDVSDDDEHQTLLTSSVDIPLSTPDRILSSQIPAYDL